MAAVFSLPREPIAGKSHAPEVVTIESLYNKVTRVEMQLWRSRTFSH